MGLARLARDGGLAGLSDPLEVARVRPQYGDRIVDPVAQTVGKNDILERLLAAVSLWPWEVLDRWHPVGELLGDR
ncbi:MAG TPA: hypothetical protein VGJ11_06955, partial [Gaiellales bacterium]